MSSCASACINERTYGSYINTCFALTAQVTKKFEAPDEAGRYPVTFMMYGPYTPTVRAKYDIVVASDDDHMRLSHL